MLKDYRFFTHLYNAEGTEKAGLSVYVDLEDEMIFVSFHDHSKTHSLEVSYDYTKDDLGLAVIWLVEGLSAFDKGKFKESLEDFSLELSRFADLVVGFCG